MSASAVPSTSAPSAPHPVKGNAAGKASGFDDMMDAAARADVRDKRSSEPRPAPKPKADAAPRAGAATNDGANDANTAVPANDPVDAREIAPSASPQEVVRAEVLVAETQETPALPVALPISQLVQTLKNTEAAATAGGSNNAEPAPPVPDPAEPQANADAVATDADAQAQGPTKGDTPHLPTASSDRLTRRNDAASNAVTPVETAVRPADEARREAPRGNGPTEATPSPATVDAAPKPATDVPVAPIAPLADPVVDQATAPGGDGAQTQASHVAEVRETSLSGLSRATIDATAQISAQILRKLEGRSTRFEMALHPEDLGRVDVKLDIDSGGRLSARLAFDNPAAATDLRGRADELRRQLEDAGFHLSEDAFEFAERDSGSSAFDRGQDARHGQNRAFAAASRLNDEIDVAQPPRWMTLKLSPSGVDMKV